MPRNDAHAAKLALADGTVVEGGAIGAVGEAVGELCFNTSMSGYQEIMTDPSYAGQLMMMTYPHIGNYGTFPKADEADRPMVAGLIVRAFCDTPSNSHNDEPLQEYMARHALVGITGVDTRTLVRRIRKNGVLNAVISSGDLNDESLVEKARSHPDMAGLELASTVTTDEPYTFAEGSGATVVVYDFGVKRNILRSFADRDCRVEVVPASTPISDAMSLDPDGLFLSNGPGDPRAMPDAIAMTREAIQSGLPLFGICLGHQLMALAEGLEVYKMKVGHRGANHPVLDLATGRVAITTQNHGFAVEEEGIEEDVAMVTHRNLNDGTVEGLQYARFSGFSVQYHPEACPGPHDSRYLFDEFLTLIDGVIAKSVKAEV